MYTQQPQSVLYENSITIFLQDLVKELIHSKQRLRSTEDELKAVKNYLDNLLLRIMDTNPSLLSSYN